MEYLNAIFQGIIQGLTEFLPISSSGHLAIYQHLTGSSGESNLLFSVLLHLGTLIAVCTVFRTEIGRLILEFFRMLRDIFTGKFRWSAMNGERRMIVMMIISSAMLIPLVLPILPGGSSFKDLMDPITRGEHFYVVGLALLATAALLFVAYKITTSNRRTRHNATVLDAIVIGVGQGLAAAFPGLSRSGTTTSAALACGLNKQYATRYSFILSIPAVLAATVMELKDAVEAGSSVSVLPTLLGIVVAAVVGFAAIKLFLWMIKRNTYVIFSYYCAAAGVIVLIISIVEAVRG